MSRYCSDIALLFLAWSCSGIVSLFWCDGGVPVSFRCSRVVLFFSRFVQHGRNFDTDIGLKATADVNTGLFTPCFLSFFPVLEDLSLLISSLIIITISSPLLASSALI